MTPGDSTKKSVILNKVLVSELSTRYKACDSKGHQKPDKDKNYCGHCHRSLKYSTKTSQKSIDYFYGIMELDKELNLI